MHTKKAAAATPTPTANTVVMTISASSGVLVQGIFDRLCCWKAQRRTVKRLGGLGINYSVSSHVIADLSDLSGA